MRLPLPLPLLLGRGGQLQWGRRRWVRLGRGESGSEGGYGCGRAAAAALAMRGVVRGVVEVIEDRREEEVVVVVGDEVVIMVVVEVEDFMVFVVCWCGLRGGGGGGGGFGGVCIERLIDRGLVSKSEDVLWPQ